MGTWLRGTLAFFQQYGAIGLFVLSFVEASFFPIPPYLLSIPMTLARPKLGLFYAGVGIIGSVLGGLFGYALGRRFGRPILAHLLKPRVMAALERKFSRYGGWAIAIGGLTPIPYKVFTISAGVFRIRLDSFIPASLIARGIRFVTEALLLIFYGGPAVHFLESSLGPLNLTVLTALILIAALLRHSNLFRRRLAPAAARAWRAVLAGAARLRRRLARFDVFSWYLISGGALTVFCFVIFAKLADDVLEKELAGFDRAAGGWLSALRTGWLTSIMHGLTNLGSAYFLVPASLIAIAWFSLVWKKHAEALLTGLCMLGALGLSQLLKATFHRPRPAHPWLTQASGYSFPSGHALLTMAFFGFLAYLIMRRGELSLWRILAAGALLILPALVGVSRIYLGVHYPTDVLGGWLAAAAWVGTCIVAREWSANASAFLPRP